MSLIANTETLRNADKIRLIEGLWVCLLSLGTSWSKWTLLDKQDKAVITELQSWVCKQTRNELIYTRWWVKRFTRIDRMWKLKRWDGSTKIDHW